MNQQDLFISMTLQAWHLQVKRATAIFDSFTDEGLNAEIAPGKNRVIYLLGHLTAVNDMMLPLLGLAETHYPQLEEPFIKQPDKTISDIPSAKDLRKYWADSNVLIDKTFASLSAEEWFKKHTAVSEEDFAKEPHRNKLNVLLNRTNHLAYHIGQLVLIKS